jgi:DNA-binding beta-propeller fold protein YncE
MYISDGRNVRAVWPDGTIATLVGHHGHASGPPKPLACGAQVVEAGDTQLQWPTALAVNPADNTLHVVDDTMVLRLTFDLRLQVVAGVSPMCNNASQHNALGPIGDLAFSPDGRQLYVAEKRPLPQSGAVRVVDRYGRVIDLAGAGNVFGADGCACRGNLLNCTKTNPCFSSGHVLASQMAFASLAAVAVTPDGHVLVADNSAVQIVRLSRFLPRPSASSGDVVVADVAAREAYTFNRSKILLIICALDTYSFRVSVQSRFSC